MVGSKNGSKETILEARDGGDRGQKVAFPSFLYIPSIQHKLSQSRSWVHICQVNKSLTTDKTDLFVRTVRGVTQEDRRGLIYPGGIEHQWQPPHKAEGALHHLTTQTVALGPEHQHQL